MRDLRELNINEGGKPSTRQAPSEQLIADFQSTFGVVLPDDYISLLRFSNGGHPELNLYDGFRSVDYIYRLTDDQADYAGVWWNTVQWRSVITGNVVTIGANGGSDQIVLWFENGGYCLKLYLHDEETLVDIADSFGEFIDKLVFDPDMI